MKFKLFGIQWDFSIVAAMLWVLLGMMLFGMVFAAMKMGDAGIGAVSGVLMLLWLAAADGVQKKIDKHLYSDEQEKCND